MGSDIGSFINIWTNCLNLLSPQFIMKAECRRIDVFEQWCWRRLLRILWAVRRSNQSVLKEISPEYSLEGLTLKLQYFDYQMWRADPDAGKDWRQKEKRVAEDEMVKYHHRLKGHEFEQTLGESRGQRSLACCNLCGCKEPDMTKWLENNSAQRTM